MNWPMAISLGLGLLGIVWWTLTRPQRHLQRYSVIGLYVGVIGIVIALTSSSTMAWIWPGSQREASMNVAGYDIRYVQTPGTDGFVNTVEFVSADGRRATFVADADSEYCGYLGFAAIGTRISLRCENRNAVGYVQLDSMAFYGASCAPDLCLVEDKLTSN